MKRKNDNSRYAWFVEQDQVNMMEGIIKRDGFPIPQDLEKLPLGTPYLPATHEFLCTSDWKIYAVRDARTGLILIR